MHCHNFDDLALIKRKLGAYERKDISFNEPHFATRLLERGGSEEEVISQLLNPAALVYAEQRTGKYGDTVTTLYFRVRHDRTLILPVIFDAFQKKSLYVITYIMRYRGWESMQQPQ